MANNWQDNVRRAKALWDKKQDRKHTLVREQLERTAKRTPEQIETQKYRRELKRAHAEAQGFFS